MHVPNHHVWLHLRMYKMTLYQPFKSSDIAVCVGVTAVELLYPFTHCSTTHVKLVTLQAVCQCYVRTYVSFNIAYARQRMVYGSYLYLVVMLW